MLRRAYALLLDYDGGPYKGFQPHPALPTVGGVLAACLHRCGVRATPFGASRTDAGVHARAQVVSFRTRADLDLAGLLRALNGELPSTIRVLAARPAHTSFHAHWSSTGKVYRYCIAARAQPRALVLPASAFGRIDRTVLRTVLDRFAAAEDVGALAAKRDLGPARRKLEQAVIIDESEDSLTLEFAAAGFGKYLVRNLVAAALSAACGDHSVSDIDAMLARALPHPRRAPAAGLSLHRVRYPTEIDPFPDADAFAING